jgi:hypothetical protein
MMLLDVEEKKVSSEFGPKKKYLLTINIVSFQLVNEPINKASLSFGDAGYLNTTGIVFLSFCNSGCTAC